MMKLKYIILIGLMISVFSATAQQERKYIRQGNRDYEKAVVDSATVDTSLYQKAEVDYRKAIEKDPNNWKATYNLGNSLFKQGKFEEAMRQYKAVSSIDHDEKEELAKAFHNLGNSMLKNNKLEEAIEAYKDALRRNPSDMDTKYNLAWAQNKLRQQQQQQQQQQNNQENNQDNKEEQEQEQQQNKDQQDKQKQNEQQQQQQQQQNQDKQQQQQQQAEQHKISKEDAMRILEALQQDEKDVQKKVQKQKAQPKKRSTEKDW